jgi:hypothetical protein
MWLKEILEGVSIYPWISASIMLWIFLCLCVMFVEIK